MRFGVDSTMRAAGSTILGFGLYLCAAMAAAASINVSTIGDVIDPLDGFCSLREAIIAANTHAASGAVIGECPAGTGGDTINLPAGTYSLAIPAAGGNDATSGDLNITGTVTLIGTGNPTVQGGVAWTDGIFDIADTATVSMSGFTITGGNRNVAAGVDGGGGIRAQGPVTLTRMTITANAATHSGSGLAPGGGIFARGGAPLVIVDSAISDNTTQDSGAGIYTQGSLTMTGSLVAGNKAIGTSFSYVGGVTFFYNGVPPGILSITNSTIANNTGATSLGAAGLYVEANAAFVGTLTNVTIAGNSNLSVGGLGIFGSLVNLTLVDTLIAGNSGGTAPDCQAQNSSTITSGGNNLIGDDTGCTITSPQASDQIGTGATPIDPLLSPLANNGGPTRTMALQSGGPTSPAIDAGDDATCATTDQRGVARPQGIACDIGAYEVASGAAAPTLSSVVSRKTHGGAGTFDLPLNAGATNPTTEPRSSAVQHLLVFTFDKAVTAGNASVTEGVATAGAPTFSGSEMRVPLTAVANQQYVTVAVSNVLAADGGGGGSGSIRVGYLLGDVTQNRVVTLADLGLVNAQVAQFVTGANYLKDVNASGAITFADKGIANTQVTKALPSP
ncbi:MAG: right-handed parallel beta-helix repeat-containing protein [Betaproteobacteria bacterium]